MMRARSMMDHQSSYSADNESIACPGRRTKRTESEAPFLWVAMWGSATQVKLQLEAGTDAVAEQNMPRRRTAADDKWHLQLHGICHAEGCMRILHARLACAGRARTARTAMQSSGSRERMRMVESKPPTARKRARCRPAGTEPISRHVTS